MSDIADKERWDRVLESVEKYRDVYAIVPFLLMCEYWTGIRAFYGSNRRALWNIARFEFQMWVTLKKTSLLLAITDAIGWTKLYEAPGAPPNELMFRHGKKCSGSPNCANMSCIEESIPGWFKFVTRWHSGSKDFS